MMRTLAGLPDHFPIVVGFMACVLLLFAFSAWRYRRDTIKKRSRSRPVMIGERLRLAIVPALVTCFVLAVFALAGLMRYAQKTSGFEELMAAIEAGDEGQVRAILDTHDPGIVDFSTGRGGGKGDDRVITFPLLVAGRSGHPAIGRLLVERGADVHQQDRTRRTALFYAAHPDTSFMAALIAKGAEVNLTSGDDLRTPLDAAIAARVPAAVELLLEHGARTNTVTYGGTFPMHRVDRIDVAAVLCSGGANPAALDSNSQTPADHARLRGDTALAAFLAPDGECGRLARERQAAETAGR